MRTVRCALVAILAALLLAAALPATAQAATKVILVRHAEKVDPSRDPVLSEAGRRRAETLAHVLAESSPAALYCSQFQRTRQTLEPLAERLSLEIREARIEDVMEASSRLARRIRTEHRGRTVVVAGHSNTLPALMSELGVELPPAIADDAYDDLFVVTLRGRKARLLWLQYGDPTP